ncbi:16S rRNA (uracil1498-N3)-methyltransferase [Prevotella communis]|jgi:16S rRNA (uracil1498-N3)-methyltransferase|uniref:Ribosomal RNA small subunit methyltransferase E n=1 Tax=Prevotella communis TaxID=2913614 RepID=A0A1G7ULN6_9BACT|nr:16S rRNA (uracil(1498)-N(3))-methyltransferase [Prevotella communis]SDG48413.1 16S rRNA (uracil1498-N3)-methyltransferase [Prevotella communis]
MKETRYFFVPDAAKQIELPDDEAVHAVRVLRMQAGDEMMLMDGQGSFYRAVLTLTTQKRCQYEIVETLPQKRQWKGCIHLAIAPTKLMDRIEWMAEKATEVGLDKLSFLDCAFSERKTLKLPRVEKIVVSAVKQSRKAYMPELTEMTPFKNFIQQHTSGHRYIAHCYDEVPRVNLFDELKAVNEDEDTLVMIGPEGDFSIDEVRLAVDAGFISVDLGKSRLRTETAGLSAVMMMQLAKQC